MNEEFGEKVAQFIEKGIINKEQIHAVSREGKSNTLTRQQKRDIKRKVEKIDTELLGVDLVTLPVLEEIIDKVIVEVERVFNQQAQTITNLNLGIETISHLLIEKGIFTQQEAEDTAKGIVAKFYEEQKQKLQNSEEEENNGTTKE